MSNGTMYQQIALNRNDAPELRECVERTVQQLLREETSAQRPGILLGKIQSGKTRAFLGVIASAFDKDYDVAVILTKGTVSLAKQTLNRVQKDFAPFLADDVDSVHVFDIMALPQLTPYELGHKLIFVVKKEDDNLRRLLKAFADFPALREKKVLIIDDEADFASLTFRRKEGIVTVGVIAGQIDNLRKVVRSSSFLQVTATPYSLYLQPEEAAVRNGNPLFLPKRPAFTEILPTHPDYVGGDYYFEKSSDPDSTAFYFYEDVSVPERDALKLEDRRRLKIEDILNEKNVTILRLAIVNFVMGAAIRRIQQQESGQPTRKYSFLFHTEQARKSHDWQEEVVTAIRDQLVEAAQKNNPRLDLILRESYDDLKRSMTLGGDTMPDFATCAAAVRRALTDGFLMITKVNSDKDVAELLDDKGQLKLRTPMNIYIGGQILDRGITIANLIGFYYGRNPQKFQQDTVLQHSRMYGARPKEDLSVTRFYAPRHIYQVMQRIHEFDSALRDAFLSGAHDRGVYFIRRDITDRLMPCSPNKLMFSKLTSVRPGRRLLPIGFQTVAMSVGKKKLDQLDQRIGTLVGSLDGNGLIPLDTAVKLLELAYENLAFDEEHEDDRRAHIAALEHLSKQAKDLAYKDQVFLIAASDRDVARMRAEGRFSNAPDTKQQADFAYDKAKSVPVLMMMRQNGTEAKGWRGLPFWWPVIVVPRDAVTSVFAAETPAADAAIPLAGRSGSPSSSSAPAT
ncbi:MAG: Z1 domain-containing protein [Acidobacteriia bacterium]|nr:Z1 domain-containing protein [Terriglobia bacterium]